MILSVDVERAFDKIQHPFVETCGKLGIAENVLNWTESIFRAYVNILRSGEELDASLSNKVRMSTLSICLQPHSRNLG